MKALLVFRWTLAALAVVTPGSLEEVLEINAGSEVNIRCNLKNPNPGRKWYWIPQYPTCAGVKGEPEEIFSPGTGKENLVKLDRFQQRLTEEKKTRNGKPVLNIQTTYMNDSGTFICSNGRKNSSQVLVIVKPGYQNGINAEPFKEHHQIGQSVNLSCNSCEDQNDGSATGDDSITWTLNGKSVPHKHIKKLNNTIIITSFSSQFYGLWNCRRFACPGKFEGYCLESNLTISQGDGKETTSSSTPTPPILGYSAVRSMKPPFNLPGNVGNEAARDPSPLPSQTAEEAGNTVEVHLIGACVAVLLGLLLAGAVIFFICRRRQSHSVSETTREPGIQESKNPTGSSVKRDKEEPMPDDHVPKEQAEGIQYSTLKFRDPGEHQIIKTDNETPAVFYSDITAARN